MRKLTTPSDLPEGTETIVKVQWPYVRKNALVLVHARHYRHVRVLRPNQLPSWLYKQFGPNTIAYVWAVVRNGEWDFVMSAPAQDW